MAAPQDLRLPNRLNEDRRCGYPAAGTQLVDLRDHRRSQPDLPSLFYCREYPFRINKSGDRRGQGGAHWPMPQHCFTAITVSVSSTRYSFCMSNNFWRTSSAFSSVGKLLRQGQPFVLASCRERIRDRPASLKKKQDHAGAS
jgi:hypothetical protein